MEPQIPLTKKEKRELRQQKKGDQHLSARRSRRFKVIGGWIFGFVVIAGIGYGITRLSQQGGKERPGQSFPIQGQDHIAVGASHPEYNSNPPTSGWHYAESAPWGVHQNELSDEQLIHNLEHGGIWISYTGVDDATKSALEKIAKSQSKVVVEPRTKNDAPIVLAAWGRLLKLEKFDEQQISDFIKANKNKSPEPLAQ